MRNYQFRSPPAAGVIAFKVSPSSLFIRLAEKSAPLLWRIPFASELNRIQVGKFSKCTYRTVPFVPSVLSAPARVGNFQMRREDAETENDFIKFVLKYLVTSGYLTVILFKLIRPKTSD